MSLLVLYSNSLLAGETSCGFFSVVNFSFADFLLLGPHSQQSSSSLFYNTSYG